MCGRFTQSSKLEDLIERFGLEPGGDPVLAGGPRYNVAPGQFVPAVVTEPQLSLVALRWGLVPSWAKDPSVGYRMINARAETAREKPAYRKLVLCRRCLIPADGFYEWKTSAGGRKQPWFFSLKDRTPFAFAGLWDRWEGAGERPLFTCTLLTTVPNACVAPVHDRMPVILRPALESLWLGEGGLSNKAWDEVREPYPVAAMATHPVSDLVNRPANDRPECIAPVPEVDRSSSSGQMEFPG